MGDFEPVVINGPVGDVRTDRTTDPLLGGIPFSPGMPNYLFVPNHPTDVMNVQILINRVYRASAPIGVTGMVDETTLAAIRGAQQMVGEQPDGVIRPFGPTLRLLNAIGTAETIAAAHPIRRDEGAYALKYQETGPGLEIAARDFPEGFEVLAHFGRPDYRARAGLPMAADIRDTRCVSLGRHLGPQLFGTVQRTARARCDAFIGIVDKHDFWGTKIGLIIYLLREGIIVWASEPCPLPAPVRPFDGTLTPAGIGADAGQPRMVYCGTGKKPFIGRFLKRIAGHRMFYYGGILETDNRLRGFDCTTFAGNSLGLDERNAQLTSSPAVASGLGATAVTWSFPAPSPTAPPGTPPPVPTHTITNGVGTGTAVKKYFADAANTGTYLIWTTGHIIVIINKVTYDWSPPDIDNGFRQSTVPSRFKDSETYNLWKVPARSTQLT